MAYIILLLYRINHSELCGSVFATTSEFSDKGGFGIIYSVFGIIGRITRSSTLAEAWLSFEDKGIADVGELLGSTSCVAVFNIGC